MRRLFVVFMGLVASALLVSCAGAPAAEPSPSSDERVVLSFAFTGGFAQAQIGEFEHSLADATPELVLTVDGSFDTNEFKVEQAIVDAVASGAVDLGWVGVRAFSELGVEDFDALIAPLLIDSIATERAVLDSDIPEQMMDGLADIGVTGLAVMGGSLRRPIAARSPIADLAGFDGVPFYAWHGEVNGLAIAALGAQPIDGAPPERDTGIENGTILAYENTLAYLAEAADRRANIMTANVNLWPSAGVLIANPATLARLSDAQRTALLDAAEGASARSLDVLPPAAELVAAACAQGARFAEASAANLAELNAALQPVYATLRTDASTARFLDQIIALKGSTPADTVEFPQDCAAG